MLFIFSIPYVVKVRKHRLLIGVLFLNIIVSSFYSESC